MPDNNIDLHFQGQYPEEKVLAFFRYHWVLVLPRFLAIVVILFILSGMLIYLASLAPKTQLRDFFQIASGTIMLLMGIALHMLFIIGLKHFLNIIIITDVRIIEVKKSIFLHDFQDSLLLIDVLDVKRDQNGFWKNILGYGDLRMMLTSTERIYSHVPNPNYHFRLINSAKQNH